MCRSVTKCCLDHKVGMTDADYLEAWHQVVLPLAAEFQPDLVIILFFLQMFIIIIIITIITISNLIYNFLLMSVIALLVSHSSSNADSGVGRI